MVSLGIFAAATALHEVLENKRTELLDPIAVVFAALSFVINSISVYSISACTWKKEVYSIALKTEAKHISIDVAESATVLVGVLCASVISGIWDVVAALIVLGVIAYNSYQTLLDLKTFILDVSPSKEEIDKIVKVINSITGPNNFHALRARKIGDYIFIDFHLLLDDSMTLDKAHRISSLIEEKLKRVFKGKVDVVIHIEPENAHDRQHKYYSSTSRSIRTDETKTSSRAV